MPKFKVTILQYRLFHYRLELFEAMRNLCLERDIELNIVYGLAYSKEKLKKDEGKLEWGRLVNNIYFPIKEKKDLCWQPVPSDLKDSDLIVFMQENRLLSNYYWMMKRKLGGPKVAYWGHGKDFQSNAVGGIRERWKNLMINQVDWWFAYTNITVDIIQKANFPSERITCLNNAIDTKKMREQVINVSSDVLSRIKRECDLVDDSPVGLFCGSLYPDKRLELLIDSGDLVHKRYPNYRLIIIGDGSSRAQIVEAAKSRPWIKWVGVKRGEEKAAYFKLASFVLNPGLVGLHVLDAFAVGLPMISTRDAKHSPEVAYLEHGVNGFLTVNNTEEYADAIFSLLEKKELYSAMVQAATQAGELYTTLNMATNFVNGIEKCLLSRRDVVSNSSS